MAVRIHIAVCWCSPRVACEYWLREAVGVTAVVEEACNIALQAQTGSTYTYSRQHTQLSQPNVQLPSRPEPTGVTAGPWHGSSWLLSHDFLAEKIGFCPQRSDVPDPPHDTHSIHRPLPTTYACTSCTDPNHAAHGMQLPPPPKRRAAACPHPAASILGVDKHPAAACQSGAMLSAAPLKNTNTRSPVRATGFLPLAP